MPTFSRAQLGTLVLFAAFLLLAYAWRGKPGPSPFSGQSATVNPVFVEITGEVARPGVYSFSAPPTLLGVWRLVGGPEPLPPADLTLPPASRLAVAGNGKYFLGNMSGELLLTLGQALDLNTAGVEDLEALPGIGPALARRLVRHRQSLGPFRQVEDLLAVPGIGPKTLARLKPLLTASSPAK